MKKRLILTMIRRTKLSMLAVFTCCICIAIALINSPTIANPDWIARSNESADLLIEAIAAADCQKKLDVSESLQEINPTFKLCRQKNVRQAVQSLEKKLNQEKNDALRLDLAILLKVGQQELRSYRLNDKYSVPYVDLSKAILETLKSTLNDSKSPSQHQEIILAKLKQYAGLKPGTTALTSFLEQAIDSQLQKSEIALPSEEQLKNDLKNNASQIYKIQAFLENQKVPDYKPAYTQLKTQLFDYETFIRRQVLTRAKKNFRLPTELYTLKLQQQGIEILPEELIQQAHTAFARVQQQMEAIAPQIAQKRGLDALQYRDVIQILKQEKLSANNTLSLYQDRAKDLEAIIRRENLVSLPQHKFNIRLATAEENQNFPVPLYDSDSSTFVIPVLQNQKKAQLYNDFTNPAMSWTLTVHEGRPGHDLQFATIKDENLSNVRTDYAANAANVEGWATYAEEIMQPYMPLEGKFMSLQFQLLRAARAFLEPELQLGKTTKAEALKVLTVDAGFSKFFAEQEIKRYTETFIGQAPAYFYGYQGFLQLRSQAEKILGEKFTPKKFHDFVLSQGFLTPEQLKQVFKSEM